MKKSKEKISKEKNLEIEQSRKEKISKGKNLESKISNKIISKMLLYSSIICKDATNWFFFMFALNELECNRCFIRMESVADPENQQGDGGLSA